MYGYKGKKFFNVRTGAIITCETEGIDLGDEWKNMTDNSGWFPVFGINGNYVGYCHSVMGGHKTFTYKED